MACFASSEVITIRPRALLHIILKILFMTQIPYWILV
jgi:hypothetical protein